MTRPTKLSNYQAKKENIPEYLRDLDNDVKNIVSYINRSSNDGWDDYLYPGLTLPHAAATSPAIKTFRGNLQALAFAGTGGVDETFASMHILHGFRDGTVIFPHIHWSHIIAIPSGDVVWQLEYSVSKGHSGGTFPATTTVALQQTADAQYTHHLIETSTVNAIPATNLEPDSVILFRVFRDPAHASDTFENDAFLLYFDIHVQSDGILTREKVRPFTKKTNFGEISV